VLVVVKSGRLKNEGRKWGRGGPNAHVPARLLAHASGARVKHCLAVPLARGLGLAVGLRVQRRRAAVAGDEKVAGRPVPPGLYGVVKQRGILAKDCNAQLRLQEGGHPVPIGIGAVNEQREVHVVHERREGVAVGLRPPRAGRVAQQLCCARDFCAHPGGLQRLIPAARALRVVSVAAQARRVEVDGGARRGSQGGRAAQRKQERLRVGRVHVRVLLAAANVGLIVITARDGAIDGGAIGGVGGAALRCGGCRAVKGGRGLSARRQARARRSNVRRAHQHAGVGKGHGQNAGRAAEEECREAALRHCNLCFLLTQIWCRI
jgi:hypothetical protein